MSNRQFHELFLRRLVEIKCFETDWTDGGLSLLEQKLNGGMGGGELRASCKLNPEQLAEVRLSCVLPCVSPDLIPGSDRALSCSDRT